MKFKVKKGEDGQWYPSIVGANGEVMFVGEGHPDKRDAVAACDAVVMAVKQPGFQYTLDMEDDES